MCFAPKQCYNLDGSDRILRGHWDIGGEKEGKAMGLLKRRARGAVICCWFPSNPVFANMRSFRVLGSTSSLLEKSAASSHDASESIFLLARLESWSLCGFLSALQTPLQCKCDENPQQEEAFPNRK